MKPPRLKVFRGEGAFNRAAENKPDDQIVCGVVLKSGEPVYFVTGNETPDAEIQETSFLIREGRPMGPNEKEFIDAVFRNQNRALA